MTLVVAVILLSSLVMLGLLVLGILGIASKANAAIEFETNAIANSIFNIVFKLKFTPPDRPPIEGSQVELPETVSLDEEEPESGVKT